MSERKRDKSPEISHMGSRSWSHFLGLGLVLVLSLLVAPLVFSLSGSCFG